MKIKRVLFVINFYVNTTPNHNNVFDHPISIGDINKNSIYKKMLSSFEKMFVSDNIEVKFLFFAIGTDSSNRTRRRFLYGYADGRIKKVMKELLNNYHINSGVITNVDMIKLSKISNNKNFLKSDNYGSIRNLGFIFANIYDVDLLIQIDDDEIVSEDYLKTVINTIEEYNIDAFSGFYLENNSVFPSAKDILKTWPKFSYMSKDVERLTKDDSLKPAIYGKGGNMIFTKNFFSKICYPSYVFRGEDFSLLLASWIIYKNGNELAEIEKNNQIFKTYFLPTENIAVDHHPIKQSNKNQLYYLFKNLLRFAFDRNLFLHQNKLTNEELEKYGYYMYKMICIDDYIKHINNIFGEFREKFSSEYKKERIISTQKSLIELVIQINKRDLFQEYKVFQKEYVEFIRILKDTAKKS